MTSGLLIGVVLTVVAMIVFLVWTRHEVGRIDEVIEQVDRRHRSDEADPTDSDRADDQPEGSR